MSDPSTIIDVSPYVALLQPIVQAAAASAIGVLGTWVVYLAGRYLHVQIAQAAVDTLISKAQTYAGTLIASDVANLAGKSITVTDPRVAAAANSIAAKLPSILAASGWTEDRIAKLVVGEIGKLQARSGAVVTATGAVKP